MYTLIRERVASMYELSYVYNLDEMLKLYDLIMMQRDIEYANARVNWVLLLVLCAMFLTAVKWQNIVVIAVGMVVIVAGELYRMSRLPKDIKAHLTDSGRRKR